VPPPGRRGRTEQGWDLDGIVRHRNPVLLEQRVHQVADEGAEVLGQRHHLAAPPGKLLTPACEIRASGFVHQAQGEDVGDGEPREPTHLTGDEGAVDAPRREIALVHPLDVGLLRCATGSCS